jgi:two-component system OmpR family response regulator
MNAAHILIAEDEEVTRTRLESILTSEGYTVTSVGTAIAALREAREQRPDVMLLDLTLYDDDPFAGIHDGFALLTLIRRTLPHGDFPVIIYTANHSPEIQAHAEGLGVSAILIKGCSLDELRNTVREVLEGSGSDFAAA